MSLNPALVKMVAAATAKYRAEPGTGIIPVKHTEARDVMVHRADGMISNAVTGPAISAYDLAEQILMRCLELMPNGMSSA